MIIYTTNATISFMIRKSNRFISPMYLKQKTSTSISNTFPKNAFYSTTNTLATNSQSSIHDNTEPTGTNPSLTLYQYQICPFCNKTKAFLDYVTIPYKSVEVNPLTKAELKPWSGSYQKVPIAKINNLQINGSNDILTELLKNDQILSKLETKWNVEGNNSQNKPIMTIDSFKDASSITKWNDFADNQLASILYPNLCRSLRDSYDAFGYVNNVKEFTTLQKISIQTIGSFAMYMAASKIKKKLNIDDERKALYDALEKFEKDGLDSGNKKYISGQSIPNMADIIIFGVLRSIDDLPVFHDVMNNEAVPITLEWYNRMLGEINNA